MRNAQKYLRPLVLKKDFLNEIIKAVSVTIIAKSEKVLPPTHLFFFLSTSWGNMTNALKK